MRCKFFIIVAIVASAIQSGVSATTIEDVWRLYDLTPASTNNPVVARVEGSAIEIPLSEFRAFLRSSMHPGKEGKILTEAEKRAELQKLLDDYFWVWDGYTHNADRTPDVAEMLTITRDEAMKALLLEQEADAHVSSLEEYEKLKKELRQRIFDQAEIHVSPAAYEIVKAAATNAAGAGSLTAKQQNIPFATSKVGAVSAGQFLEAYFQMEPTNRPDLRIRKNVGIVLQAILGDDLLLAEARDRGLDKAESVRIQVQSDRTGLVRQWALDAVTKKTTAAMNDDPKIQSHLKKWYRAQLKALYTITNHDGSTHVLGFQKNHDEIQSDYFNHLQEQMRADELKQLRKGKKIDVDEKLLTQTVLTWPLPWRPAEMPPSLVSWNADTREFIASAGDTNVVLSFTFTNLSPYEMTVQDIHVVNEFITIESPPLPWTVPAGGHGELKAHVDLRNKKGIGYLPIDVTTSFGSKTLTLKLVYYSSAPANRMAARN